jgi:hypothetical protein
MLSDNRGGEEVKLPLKSKAVGSNRQKEGRGLVKNNDDDDRDDDDRDDDSDDDRDDDDRDDDDRDDDSDDDRDDDDNTTSLLTAMVPSDRSIYLSIYLYISFLSIRHCRTHSEGGPAADPASSRVTSSLLSSSSSSYRA